MARPSSPTARARPPAARIGPGPLPRSGPGPGAPLDDVGLAAATFVGTTIREPDGAVVGDGDGVALGLGVGLGAGVDGPGVGVGPTTVTVPFSAGWIVQWYAYVPAIANDTVLFPEGAMTPVSKTPSSDVAVCPTGSWLIQVTLSPMEIVTFCGWYEKSWMTTL